MKATITKKGITVTGIMHESHLDTVNTVVMKSGVKAESLDFHTKMKITGTQKQLNNFIKFWNAN